MTERKLATIRRIAAIDPIPGADKIERLTVDGWKLITAKDNGFQVGDLCLYFEIDSVLPVRPEFEFLRQRCFVSKTWVEGFRIKTMKMRGEVSQGLALPLKLLDETNGTGFPLETLEEGQDLTERLGVVKWDPPVDSGGPGKPRGNFPSFIPKTDQERIQNCFRRIEEDHFNDDFERTLKLDGSSCTIYCKDGVIGVCSRNLELTIDESTKDNHFVKMALKHGFEIKDTCEQFDSNLAFQGEVMGPGIQQNREGLKDHTFFLYDIYDINEQRYLDAYERANVLVELNAIDGGNRMNHVPVESIGRIFAEGVPLSVYEFIDAADRHSLSHSIAEGDVYKSVQNPDVSFKVINNYFLLKED